ncbi:ABC transporter permease subunit [Microbacterium ulmi]|uniref:ABC transporter permease n=1 Tax=Microbacterium ulmi TaxID=179095 RepID=A0A7Y2M2A7_9MICO|nr:peptide/nickel transport system permease protein [Microbacterium ulmi]NNH05017.1 ABC transporter permease [Microbacterium ulmi]
MILRRTLEAVSLLLELSFLIFLVGAVIPGDAALAVAGQGEVPLERLNELREQLGLNDPIIVRYWTWLSGALTGDLGNSVVSQRPILADVARAFPVTLELSLLGMAVALAIGLPVGVFAASHAGSVADRVLRGSTLLFLSLPSFVLALLLILSASRFLPAIYSSFYVGFAEDPIGHLRSVALPALAVGLPLSGQIAQITRSSMVEAVREPFVLTARAKGLSPRRIEYDHALRVALSPIVTLSGLLFGSLIGGLLLIERIFNLPGLGRALINAIGDRDFQFVVAATLVIAGVYVVVNLIVDLLYPILDPRQRR